MAVGGALEKLSEPNDSDCGEECGFEGRRMRGCSARGGLGFCYEQRVNLGEGNSVKINVEKLTGSYAGPEATTMVKVVIVG